MAPAGGKGGKGRDGEREGDLAIETWHKSESSLRVRSQQRRRVRDIGLIETVWATA